VYGLVKVRRVYKLDKIESQYGRPGVETTVGMLKPWVCRSVETMGTLSAPWSFW
jgi:hypothetical protein